MRFTQIPLQICPFFYNKCEVSYAYRYQQRKIFCNAMSIYVKKNQYTEFFLNTSYMSHIH